MKAWHKNIANFLSKIYEFSFGHKILQILVIKSLDPEQVLN
jgi:hypothetical protein